MALMSSTAGITATMVSPVIAVYQGVAVCSPRLRGGPRRSEQTGDARSSLRQPLPNSSRAANSTGFGTSSLPPPPCLTTLVRSFDLLCLVSRNSPIPDVSGVMGSYGHSGGHLCCHTTGDLPPSSTTRSNSDSRIMVRLPTLVRRNLPELNQA